jgi:uncharacterized phiE125 gp8 family phage protein
MPIPVTFAEATRQLKVDDPEQYREIHDFIADAAAWVERYTGHILVARDVTQEFSSFDLAPLHAWPIKPGAVATVTYRDGAGDAQPVTGMRLCAATRPAKVIPFPSPGFGASTLPQYTNMIVTVRAGYEDSDEVPGNFRRAMLVLIGAYDVDREGGEILQTAEATARRLCRDYRAWHL